GDGHVDAAYAAVAACGRKGIGQGGAGAVVVQAKAQVVTRTSAKTEGTTAARPWLRRRGSQGAIQAEVDIVTVVADRGDIVKVLRHAGEIGQRNVSQQALRDGTDLAARRALHVLQIIAGN